LQAHAFWAADGAASQCCATPDVLVRVDADTWLWAAGRTPEALQQFVGLLPGDWLMTEDVTE
jgi:hypothetical protein